MDKLRLKFSKTGRAVYISHLDLMRTMQRAFLRAGLPLKYSEGFNPHAQISILLPLSVGCASLCELMDFQLREETELAELPELLSRVLPEGITALEAYVAQRKVKDLKWLRVAGRYEYDNAQEKDFQTISEKLMEFYSADKLIITRRTKRGEGETDIAPAIDELSVFPQSDSIELEAVISAQEPTLNPDHLVQALKQLAPELAPDFASFTRLEVYDREMNAFR